MPIPKWCKMQQNDLKILHMQFKTKLTFWHLEHKSKWQMNDKRKKNSNKWKKTLNVNFLPISFSSLHLRSRFVWIYAINWQMWASNHKGDVCACVRGGGVKSQICEGGGLRSTFLFNDYSWHAYKILNYRMIITNTPLHLDPFHVRMIVSSIYKLINTCDMDISGKIKFNFGQFKLLLMDWKCTGCPKNNCIFL